MDHRKVKPFRSLYMSWVSTVSKIELFILLVLTLVIRSESILTNRDDTRQPNISGNDVVDATISQIVQSGIFGDDNGFLRRIACVESKYGTDLDTYRRNYHGGIWQVGEIFFEDTKNATNHPAIVSKLPGVSNLIGKAWSSVLWEDLRKPIYSALAARLFLCTIVQDIPGIGDLDEQANYWKLHYNTKFGDGSREIFLQSVAGCEEHIECQLAALDVVFVMEGSENIGPMNFNTSKYFVSSIIDHLYAEGNATRVGVIQYDSQPHLEICFGAVNNKEDLKAMISGIGYSGGDGTETGAAIEFMMSAFFEAAGRNKTIPRVGIVITGAQSEDDVLPPANNARDQGGVTMFAVGVGNGVNETELNDIAHEPDHFHRFKVSDFNVLDNIKNVLTFATCAASSILETGSKFTTSSQPSGVRFTSIPIPDNGQITFKLETGIGVACAFLSTLISNPNSAFYEWKLRTTEENNYVEVFIDVSDRTGVVTKRQANQGLIYMTIVNTGNSTNEFTVVAEVGDTRLDPSQTTQTAAISAPAPTGVTDGSTSAPVITPTPDGSTASNGGSGISSVQLKAKKEIRDFERRLGVFDDVEREYEGYDGWYNNKANPSLGAADAALSRRLPVAYGDGVYSMAGQDRPNPFDISWKTMRGLTGKASFKGRTAFMTFFSQQVVDEILNTRSGGCPVEYENVAIPGDHEFRQRHPHLKEMPFVRTRHSFDTGFSPNVPREQMNEHTPWIDGSVMYGTTKVWADNLRSFKGGRLADYGKEGEFPELNTIGLPMANLPNPAEHKYRDAKRYFKLGNSHGNENPFILTLGILWFRWHNYWADKFHEENPNWSDEKIYLEARKWVIATYQKFVFYDWLPAFLDLTADEMNDNKYTGYKSYVLPGITHEFQSAAMRWGHTIVPPGVYRRDTTCHFIKTTLKSSYTPDGKGAGHHGVRTCNSFWNPQVPVQEHDIEVFLMGMASQITEREDNIVTSDLQRRVYGPLDFSRRDLMVLNIQRGRDSGLPDYNTAREALGLKKRESFLEINPWYNDSTMSDIDESTLGNLEEVYGYDINKVDIWAGGLHETTARGPGELFHTIILDQFIRIRDGDRFWFENEHNGLFTEEQIEYIHNLSVHDVITRCTNISPDDIQKDVFHFVQGDPCWDEAIDPDQGGHGNLNRTVSELHMDECTNLETYDYFTNSEVSFALTFLAAGVWIVGCILLLQLLAKWRSKQIEEVRQQLQKRPSKPQSEETKSYAATEWCGSKQSKQPVKIMFRSKKQIKVHNKVNKKKHRIIDLSLMQNLTFFVSPDRKRQYVLIKIDQEYDLVMRFDEEEQRMEFISDLEHWLDSPEVGIKWEQKEIREKYLLKMVVTKEDRRKTLENFFRLAFAQVFNLEVDPDETEGKASAVTKDNRTMTCELSKTEFAEILSMQPNSLFVEQMFGLVDKDQSGSISFREFLDVLVIFAKGKPEDKIQLMFNMYDIDRSGFLDRDEFKTMLKSMMEMVNASLEPSQLEEVIGSMFTAAGFENKEELSLQDFLQVMADHKTEFSEAALRISDEMDLSEEPQQEKRKRKFSMLKSASKSEHKKTTTDHESEETTNRVCKISATDRARQTVVQAYQDHGKKGAVPKRTKSKKIKVETEKDSDPKTKKQQAWKAALGYIENHRLHIFWLNIYILVVLAIFAERAYYYSIEREHRGLRRIAGYGVTVTRGAASAMMFTYSSLLVTMCRNTITKLRETFLHLYIPFDAALAMHKIIAYLALFFTVMHIVGHGLNFYHINTQPPEDLLCYFSDFFHRSHTLTNFHYWCWKTVTGFTGVLLVLVGAVIYTFAIQFARRSVFNWFWSTHNMFVIYYMLMILHGSGRLVQPGFMWYFFLGPAILFTLDKLVSIARKKAEITVLKAQLLPSDVTNLVFKRPSTFDYKSGQWVRIACTELGGSEYHPFTLSSSPHEENLTLHIRAIGPWTINLRQTFDPDVVGERPYPKLYLDGPYGEGHQDWSKFEVSVLVGGGIGVTPFASILKDIAHKSSMGQHRMNCKKVHFIWVTRTQKHFEWLTDIIREVEEKDTSNLVTVHLFITQFFQKFDLRTTMLYICERHFQKISDRSLFTGLRSATHFGRPNFFTFLDSLQNEHPEVHKIGVFSCGPPGMTSNVEKACVELNKFDSTAFIHHYENF